MNLPVKKYFRFTVTLWLFTLVFLSVTWLMSVAKAGAAETTPPLTTPAPIMGTYGANQSVALSCTGGIGSGGSTTYYCLGNDCLPTTVYSGPISILSSTSLSFYSTDVANNIEQVKTHSYTIDPSMVYRFAGLWPQLTQPWYYRNPSGVAVDASGNVYVVDTDNNRIQKFDSSGAFVTTWGSQGNNYGQFSSPRAITVDSAGNVYVVDSSNNRIQKFDSGGAFVTVWGVAGSGNGQFAIPQGITVDSSGNVYVSDFNNNRIQKFNSSGAFVSAWGSSGSGNGQFNFPQGIAVDSAGNVYVVDSGNNRIQKFDPSGTFVTAWGSYGSGNGEFISPQGLSVDLAGNVYVVDSGNNRIQKFDSGGVFVSSWGSQGSGTGQFSSPRGITVDSAGNVYIDDAYNNRIQKFDSNGAFLTAWGSSGNENGWFSQPSGTAVDSAGNVYVVETNNNRVQKFNSSGVFVTAWGSQGSGTGQFSSPRGISVDSTGNVYVVDSGNNRIQKFDPSGAFVTAWGTSGSGIGQFGGPFGINVDSFGNVYVADTENNRIQKFDSSGAFATAWGSPGNGNGQFNRPRGISVDSTGNVYVADADNSRIQKFTSSGDYVTAWGVPGSGNGQLNGPHAITLDPAGNLYIADTKNHRVQKFDSSGAFVTAWGSYGSGIGQFILPFGITVDSAGNVFVADTYNHRIQKFNQTLPVAPGPPDGVTATAGNGQATVSFTAPGSDGGSAILFYTLTSTPGNVTVTGSSSPITVSGLTNGIAYTFTATATSTADTGPASAPSNSVTPYANYSVPTVTGHQPANGTTVPINATVQATFSEPMDPASLTPESFTLSRFVLFKAIAGGDNFTLGLKNDGTVLGWGGLTAPTGLSGIIAIASGDEHSLALKNDGTVVAWGGNSEGESTVPTDLSGVTAISAGYGLSAALKNNGTVVTWGWNIQGITTPPWGLSGVTAIAAGGFHMAALKNDGTVVTWGYGDGTANGKTADPYGITGIKAIAAGMWHTLALKNDGTVVGWHTNGAQINIPQGLSGVKAIAAGSDHNAALKYDGTVVIWGSGNGITVSAGLSGVSAISAGGSRIVALKNDGTVIAWGLDGSEQTSVPAGLTPTETTVSGSVSYDSSSLTATYTPSSPLLSGVTYFATLTAARNLSETPMAAPFRWSFTTVDTKLVVTPNVNDFGTVIIGTDPPSQSFTISNPGVLPVAVSAITLEGPDAALFSMTPDSCQSLSPTIAAGASCKVNIAFAPTAGGLKTATLHIDSNSISNPSLNIPLSATGILLHNLSITASGSGTGQITYSTGGACTGNCNRYFTPGTLVTLTPIADSGSAFIDWTGCDSINGTLCKVTMTNAKNVSVSFVLGTAPKVIDYQPGNGSYAPIPGNVQATFSEPLNPDSVNPGSFTVSRITGNFRAIAAGYHHTLALKADGTVVAWGKNDFGQTAVPVGLSGVTAISAGNWHNLALKGDGTVVAWGNNDNGQCIVPAGLSGVIAVAAGAGHSVALKNDGTVVAWGINNYGGPALPAGLSGVVAIAAGYGTVALKNDGTVVVWGPINPPPAGLTGVKAVAVVGDTGIALKNDGTVVAWGGNNYYGQADVPAGLTGVTAIAAGPYNVAALKNDGTVVTWGSFFYTISYNGNIVEKARVPEGLFGVIAIATGAVHTVALKNDGTLVIWGTDYYNAIPHNLKGVATLATGEEHTIALKKDGTVIAWGGSNASGETTVPEGLSNVVSIAGGGHHTVALKNDGTVVAWGDNTFGQTSIPAALSAVKAIAAGSNHSVALKIDGTVVAWGDNGFGQSTVPVGLTGVKAIAAGGNHTVALKSDGTVVAWGQNLNTVYWDGSIGGPLIPAGLTDVVAISAGYGITIMLKADGTVVTSSLAPSAPAGLSGVVAVAAGGGHIVALKNDGEVVTWGSDFAGQLTIPAGLSGVIAIAAGNSHSVALKSDGTVVSWGGYNYGQASVPAYLLDYAPPLSGSLQYDADSLTATFYPSSPLVDGGSYHVSITDVRSQAGVPLATPVSWSFTALGPHLLLNPLAQDFGNVFLNDDPATQTFTIRNGGITNLIVSGISLGGVDAGMFNVTPGTCSALATTIAVGGSCTVNVSFAPASAGLKGATLQIISNVIGNPEMSVPLKGTGLIGFPLTITGSGTGRGTINYSTGGSCGGNCRPYFLPGSVITLTPIADSSSVFGNWSGCDSVTGDKCTVTMSSAKNVTVSFTKALKVISYQPANGASAPINTTVRATFSDPLNPATFTPGNFTLARSSNTKPVMAIAAGASHTIALKNDGTVVAWGGNYSNQTTVPAGLTGVTAIAAGDSHTVALKNDGTVVAWGYNAYAQTTVPAGLSGVAAIAAGGNHSVALKNDGTVVAWGYNAYGQTTVPAGLSGIATIAAGRYHTVALKNDGTVIGWGYNGYGQTTAPADLTGVTAIAARDDHTIALKSDGTIVAWGRNNSGQLTVPAGLTGVIAISAGEYFTAALRNDGTVVTWGGYDSNDQSTPAGLTGVIAIAVGSRHFIALKNNSTVVAWGYNYSGQTTIPVDLNCISGTLAYEPTTLTATFTPSEPLLNSVTYYATIRGVASQTGVPLVAAVNWSFRIYDVLNISTEPLPPGVTGTGYSQILVATGGLAPYSWAITSGALPAGMALDSATGKISGTATAAGIVDFTVQVTDSNANRFSKTLTLTISPAVIDYQPAMGTVVPLNSTVRATFSDPLNPATVTTGNFTLSRYVALKAIAAGYSHTVALKTDSTVIAWGNDGNGQATVPAGLTGVTAIATGSYHTVALKGDGTVVAWGDYWYGATAVPVGLTGVVAIAAGGDHNVALKNNGTLVAWGDNGYGQNTVPAGLSGVVNIAAGYSHSMALKSDGTVVAWGANTDRQSTVPAGLTGVAAIATGRYHSVALKGDGTVIAWGDNTFGQATVPAGLSGVTAIAAGWDHNLALKTDGTVVAWGRETTVPAGLTGVIAIVAGAMHTVALKADGTVVAWGNNDYGQTTIPACLSSISGTLTYSPASLTATFTPSVPLIEGVTYYATIAGVASQTGVLLAAPVSWSFKAMKTLPLSVTLTGNGAGSVYSSPAPNINCYSGSCSQTYQTGTIITLTALPVSGSIFTGWSGACTGSGQCQLTMNAEKILNANFALSGDSIPPNVTSFTMPATATQLIVPVTGITASDNVAVTGYLITESPIKPSSNSTGWSSAPSSFTFSAPGNCYAYAWARDAAGNVSASSVAMVSITLNGSSDTTAPQIAYFVLPSSTTLTVPISSLAVTDNIGVSGYIISEDPATPLPGDTRWTSTPPTSFTFISFGNRTLYAWVKDAAGNVSARTSATCQLMDPAAALDTVVTGRPADSATIAPSTFTFIASKAGVTFECSLDSGSYFACANPVNFGSLANGSHTFSVRAKDGVVYDETPASYTWTVSVPLVRINLSSYTSIANAYAASSDGHNLEIKGLELREDIVFDRPISITLKGGYDSGFLSTTGTTAIHGALIISNGTVTIENISIM